MQPAAGSLVLYATEPGSLASDGLGSNGLFTKHLANAINRPGLNIEQVFKATALSVSKSTNKQQIPYIEGVILGEFYFIEPDNNEGFAVNYSSNPSNASVIEANSNERLFWKSVLANPTKDREGAPEDRDATADQRHSQRDPQAAAPRESERTQPLERDSEGDRHQIEDGGRNPYVGAVLPFPRLVAPHSVNYAPLGR